MGGHSSSSSSSAQTTQTENVSIGDTQGLTLAGIDRADITVTDAGATAKAIDLSSQALDGGVNIVSGLFDYLESTQNKAVGAVSDTAKLATAALAETKPVNASTTNNGLVLLGGAAVVSWAVVNYYRSKK